jgi:hypothetical protein
MRKHYTLQVLYRLPDALSRILLLLIDRATVSVDDIEKEHKLATQANVAIHRLRRRVAPYRIEIKHKKALGYYIEHEQKIIIIDQMKRVDNAMPPEAA